MTDNHYTSESAYIYTLTDPRDGQIRYVGRTMDWYRRKRSYRSNTDTFNRRLSQWIDDLRLVNLLPQFDVIAITNADHYKDVEEGFIRQYLAQGMPLFNQKLRIREKDDYNDVALDSDTHDAIVALAKTEGISFVAAARKLVLRE